MLIQYVGRSTVREWPPYRFTYSNGRAQVVDDAETIVNMLTQPGDDFVVHPLDPLAALIGQEQAAEAALRCVLTVEDYQRAPKMFVEEVNRPTTLL
jgi:hypothetical protein